MSANAKQQNKTFTSYNVISYCLHASIETKLPLAEAAAFCSGVFADFLVGLALVVVAFLAFAAVLRVVFAMMNVYSCAYGRGS